MAADADINLPVTLVSGAFVLTMDSSRRVLRDGAVAIQGQSIVDVGPVAGLAAKYPRALRVGGKDFAVLPGFVNTHNHMFQVLYRTLGPDVGMARWLSEVVFPMSRGLREEEAHAAALLASTEMLKTGTTTVVDSHYVNPTDGMMDAVADAVKRIGIRAILGRASRDPSEFQLIPNEFAETPDHAQKASVALIERWHGAANGRIRIRPEPVSETQASAQMIRGLHEVATNYGTGMNMHAAEMLEQVQFIRAHHGTIGSIEYLDGLGILSPDLLLAHCVWLAPEEIRLLRDRGVRVVHNPTSNQFLGDGIAPLPELAAAGVPTALGTDGPCSNDSLDMFGVMKAGALLHKGVRRDGTVTNAGQILEMATTNGAIAAGLGEQIGALEVGRRADLITVSLRRPELVPLFDIVAGLVYATSGAAVDTVVVDGKVVVEHGVLATVDEDEVLRQAELLAWRLLNRSAGSELQARAGRLGRLTFASETIPSGFVAESQA